MNVRNTLTLYFKVVGGNRHLTGLPNTPEAADMSP